MSRKHRGLIRRKGVDGQFVWHIDKKIKGYGRLCESCGTDDEDEAGDYLTKRLKEIRDATVHGLRPKRSFRQCAARYLNENSYRRGISRDRDALVDMDSFIGDLYIDQMHDGSFERYREARRNPTEPRPGRKKIKPLSNGTLNRHIGVAARVLHDCATKWRDERANLTWLAQEPWINANAPHRKRQPYPLDWDEQQLIFEELAPHLQRMALFDVNTGARDEEMCALEWAWEQRVPELDTPAIRRTVFVIPGEVAKNRTEDPQPRLLVLNDAAQSIIDSVRGEHPRYVFTYENYAGTRDRLYTARTTGWLAARRRAAARYAAELGREAPPGFKGLRVHDMRHTFGRRLRAAGVSFEDRQDLLGHKSDRVTTHYSAAEIGNLVEAANQVIKSRKSPARTVLRMVSDRVSA